jgi:flagellar hook-basal body complex protein FliE
MIDKVGNQPSLLPNLKHLKDTEQADGQFENTLKSALNEINDLQKDAGDTTDAFLRGEITDLHQVTIATQKARLGLELLLEIRNKMVESYQEIMRMQL